MNKNCAGSVDLAVAVAAELKRRRRSVTSPGWTCSVIDILNDLFRFEVKVKEMLQNDPGVGPFWWAEWNHFYFSEFDSREGATIFAEGLRQGGASFVRVVGHDGDRDIVESELEVYV